MVIKLTAAELAKLKADKAGKAQGARGRSAYPKSSPGSFVRGGTPSEKAQTLKKYETSDAFTSLFHKDRKPKRPNRNPYTLMTNAMMGSLGIRK